MPIDLLGHVLAIGQRQLRIIEGELAVLVRDGEELLGHPRRGIVLPRAIELARLETGMDVRHGPGAAFAALCPIDGVARAFPPVPDAINRRRPGIAMPSGLVAIERLLEDAAAFERTRLMPADRAERAQALTFGPAFLAAFAVNLRRFRAVRLAVFSLFPMNVTEEVEKLAMTAMRAGDRRATLVGLVEANLDLALARDRWRADRNVERVGFERGEALGTNEERVALLQWRVLVDLVEEDDPDRPACEVVGATRTDDTKEAAREGFVIERVAGVARLRSADQPPQDRRRFDEGRHALLRKLKGRRVFRLYDQHRTGVEVGVIPGDVLDQRRLEQLRRDHRRDLAAAWLRRCQHWPAGDLHTPGAIFARGAARLLGEYAISICPFG